LGVSGLLRTESESERATTVRVLKNDLVTVSGQTIGSPA